MTKNKDSLSTDKLESENCEANQSGIEDEEVDKKLKSRNADGCEDTVSALEKHDIDDVSTIKKESSEKNADYCKEHIERLKNYTLTKLWSYFPMEHIERLKNYTLTKLWSYFPMEHIERLKNYTLTKLWSYFPMKPNSSKESQKAQEKQTNTEIAWKWIFLIFSIIVIPIIATFAYKFLYLSVIPDISQDHSFIKPEEFDLKITKMIQKFKNQDKMFWRQIRTRGFIHLKRAFNQSKKKLVPSTIFIAGYNGTDSTMDCFLKYLGHSFTNERYETLYSEGVSKESLDEQINQSLNGTQKYVVMRDIHKMSFDAASLFMAYADEHLDNAAVSFPLSVIVMTAEMPFSSDDPYDRKADEIKVRKHFVSNLWGEDENNSAALWSRIGNLVVLLKSESLTDRCD